MSQDPDYICTTCDGVLYRQIPHKSLPEAFLRGEWRRAVQSEEEYLHVRAISAEEAAELEPEAFA